MGFMCGRLLVEKICVKKGIVKVIRGGVIMVVMGYVVWIWMGIKKGVWCRRLVLVRCGWGCVVLGLVMYVIEVKKMNKGWRLLVVLGMKGLLV